MKKWRKSTAVLIVVALAASLVAGCSSKSNNKQEASPISSSPASTSPASSPEQSPEQSPEASQEPVVIEYLAHNSYAQITDEEHNYIKNLVEKKFNAKFNVWYLDAQNREESFIVKLSAGEMPDIMTVVGTMQKLIDQGVAAPIDEAKIREFAPTYAKFIDEKYPLAWDFGKYDGKLYGLPTTNINASYPTAVIWREDWLKKVGITKTPETIQEVEEALTKFRNDDPDGNNKKDTYGMSDFAIPIILGAFGRPGIEDFKAATREPARAALPMLKDGKVVIAAIQPEMKEALALLQKWYKAGLIDPEFVTSENTSGYWADSHALYNNCIGLTGKGMFTHWRNELDPGNPEDTGGGQYAEFKAAQPNGSIVFGKAPVGPEGQAGTPKWLSFGNGLTFTTQGVKDPRKVETLLKMMEASASDYEYWLTVTEGEKDKDWKFDDKGNFVALNSDDTATAASKGRFVFTVGSGVDDFFKKKTPFLFQFADKTKVQGYDPLPMPVVDSFSNNISKISKIIVEAYFKIISGEAAVDSFDDMVKAVRSNGGDQIEQDWTAAYNQMLGK